MVRYKTILKLGCRWLGLAAVLVFFARYVYVTLKAGGYSIPWRSHAHGFKLRDGIHKNMDVISTTVYSKTDSSTLNGLRKLGVTSGQRKTNGQGGEKLMRYTTKSNVKDSMIIKIPRNITDAFPDVYSFTNELNERIAKDTEKVANILSRDREVALLCMSNNYGQLGNKMFQFASLYGIAKNLRMKPIVDSKIYSRLADRFKLQGETEHLIVNRTQICKPWRKHTDIAHSTFEEKSVNRWKTTKDIDTAGFYQSWMYFHNIIDEIRQQLTYVDSYRDLAQDTLYRAVDLISEIRQELKDKTNLTYVGIHVRRGSLANQRYSEYGIMVADKEYFKRAMNYFEKKYQNVVFIACSNEGKWVVEHIKHPRLVLIQSNRPDVEMSVLTHCNHTIMSVGTFGWWLAFLTGGETVYYKTPARHASDYSKTFSTHMTDFYPPYWIPM